MIINIQQARAIIAKVGEKHQHTVSEMLRGLTYSSSDPEHERDAQKVIDSMERYYVLSIANALLAEKYDQIPEYIKNYSNND